MDSESPKTPGWVDAFLASSGSTKTPEWHGGERLVLLHTTDTHGAKRLASPDRQLAPQASGGCLIVEPATVDGTSCPTLDRLLADATRLKGRSVVVLAPGAIGQASLLGEAPRAIRDACRRAPAAPGLYIDANTHPYVQAAAEPVTSGYRLNTGRRWPLRALAIAGGVAAVVTLGALAWPAAPQPSEVGIYVNASRSRGGAARHGDEVIVSVTGKPQHFVTLLLLDSSDTLQVVSGQARNRQLSDAGLVTYVLVLDEVPGLERFIAIVSPEPPKQPIDRMVARVNEEGGDRATRFATIKRRLKHLNNATVVPALDLRHQ